MAQSQATKEPQRELDLKLANADSEYLKAIDKPIVYVAGPMRGIPEYNFPAFDEASEWLRNEDPDLYVVSPADMDRALGFNESDEEIVVDENFIFDAMRRDLRLVTHCHAILLLEGWEGSTGANNEFFVAQTCGVQIWEAIYHKAYTKDANGSVVGYANQITGYKVLTYPEQNLRGPTFATAEDRLANTRKVSWSEDGLEDNWNLDFFQGSTPPKENLPETPASEEFKSVLLEADYLINGPRQATYSHPYDDFSTTSEFWKAYLKRRNNGIYIEILPEDIGQMMVLVKMARELHTHKRDNIVDQAGYSGTVQMVHDRYEEMKDEA